MVAEAKYETQLKDNVRIIISFIILMVEIEFRILSGNIYP